MRPESMRAFFHGWRRKAGCVTLVIACVFAGGWVRSLTIRDSIQLPGGDMDFDLAVSENGELKYVDFYLYGPRKTWSIRTYPVPYRSIVIPLTMLSAWLMFYKPRPAKPKPGDGSPIPEQNGQVGDFLGKWQ